MNLIETTYNDSDDESSQLDKHIPLNTSNDTNSMMPDKAIKFHHVIGKNIILSSNKKEAQRVENSFCDAIVFSSRPIGVYERVYVKITKLSTLWNGMIRFGFTSVSPDLLIKKSGNGITSLTESFQNMNVTTENEDDKYPFDLPRYVYPDLTNKKGYWAGAVDESLLKENDVLYFYVNSNGEIHYGVNNKYKGKFLDGVDVYNNKPQQAQPLWAIFDIYGNTISIELINNDPNEPSRQNEYDYLIRTQSTSPPPSYLQENHNFRTLLNNSSSISSTGSSPSRSLNSNSSLMSSNASSSSNNSMTTVIPSRSANQRHLQAQPVVLRQKKNETASFDRLLISCRRLCVDNHLNETLRNSIIETNDVNEPETSRLNERIRYFYEQIPVLIHDAQNSAQNKFLAKVHGKNVEISKPDGCIAYRESSLKSLKERHSSFNQTFTKLRETLNNNNNNKEPTRNAYVFLEKPMEKGKSLCVQIVGIDQTANEAKMSLGIGCTTCDPAKLNPKVDLPDDADDLMDRAEYWVVIKNLFNNSSSANNHQVSLADELCFRLDESSGNVSFCINGNLVNRCLFSVDQTQKLWFFFDLCGKTNAIRLITPCESSRSTLSTLNSGRNEAEGHNGRGRPDSALMDYYKTQFLVSEPKKAAKESEKKQNVNTEECRICWDAPIECVFYSCGHMCLCWNWYVFLYWCNFFFKEIVAFS